MGISKNQLEIASNKLAEFTVEQVSTVTEKLDIVKQEVNNISIAQKTVNTKGIKELMTSEEIMEVSPATQTGTSVRTTINKDITLSESIENFDIIKFHAAIKSVDRFYQSLSSEISVDKIIYNPTNSFSSSDGSVIIITIDLSSTNSLLGGMVHCCIVGWFKTPNIFRIAHVDNPNADGTTAHFSTIVLKSIKGVKIENVTIDPIEYVNTNSGIEDTPVGHILSLMGKSAPSHYLICDGAEYNIADYPYLSQYVKDQFGSFNFFGGDGTNTFAVPDLRGEFLRGAGSAIRNTGSGSAVGVHQNPTEYPSCGSNTNDPFYIYRKSSGDSYILNPDKFITDKQVGQLIRASTTSIPANWTYDYSYTSRPTNTAVLYCIKYEPTYFMNIQGLIEETPLWEGTKIFNCREGSMSAPHVIDESIILIDNIFNYDKIEFRYNWYNSSNGGNAHFESKQYYTKDIYVSNTIGQIILKLGYNYTLGIFGFLQENNRIQFVSTISDNISTTSGTGIRLTKIVGIKYKTFPNGNTGNGNGEPYEDQEIVDFMEDILNEYQ